MATNADSTDERIELPTDFATSAAEVSDLDEPPATLEEWWTVVFAQYEERDLAVTLDDLYSPDPTRHEVRVDDRVRYAYCVADALAASVLEGADEVTVRSIDPVTERPVTVSVVDSGVEVAPEGARISFGMDLDHDDVAAAGSLAEWSLQDDTDAVTAGICRYTNAFETAATYERWTTATGCVSVSLPPVGVVRVLRTLL